MVGNGAERALDDGHHAEVVCGDGLLAVAEAFQPGLKDLEILVLGSQHGLRGCGLHSVRDGLRKDVGPVDLAQPRQLDPEGLAVGGAAHRDVGQVGADEVGLHGAPVEVGPGAGRGEGRREESQDQGEEGGETHGVAGGFWRGSVRRKGVAAWFVAY